MTADFTTLKSIFRMMAPADLLGVQKNVLGLAEGNPDIDQVQQFLQILHDPDGGGALPVLDMHRKFTEQTNGLTESQARQVISAVRFYALINGNTSIPTINDSIDWYKKGYNYQSQQTEDVKLDQFIASDAKANLLNKNVAIVLSDSNFIDPSRHQIANAELFMNFIPTHVMSRCSPFLSTEFTFDGNSFADENFSRPGLLRFLMGGGSQDISPQNRAMLDANNIQQKNGNITSVMGMEAFTSPQTLVNPDTIHNSNRYTAVQDPFRPLASIESMTANIQSTIGYAMNQVITLTLKVHDRSRLAELAEFIRPANFPSTTIWVEYGWQHPPEINNPYANLINDKMRIRQALSIKNTSFNFDNAGQVQVQLILTPRSQVQMDEVRFNELTTIFREISNYAEKIRQLRKKLGLDGPTGLSKDIKGAQLLEYGSKGNLPDFPPGELETKLNSLEKNLKSGSYDPDLTEELLTIIKTLYKPNITNTGSFKQRMTRTQGSAAAALFNLWKSGPDPFLMTSGKDGGSIKLRVDQMKKSNKFPQQLVNYIDSSNTVTVNTAKKIKKTNNSIASFGKIFTSTMLSTAIKADAADDIQFYFYRTNNLCGSASNINLAEFPIDLNRLRIDVSELLSQKKSDNFTVVEFINLLINSQLRDPFSPAYGLQSYKEQFNPKNKDKKAKAKNNFRGSKNNDTYESVGALIRKKIGPFKPPIIELHVENISASIKGVTEIETKEQKDSRKTQRVLRFHIYDKNVDQYPHASMLLKADDSPDAERFFVSVKELESRRAEPPGLLSSMLAGGQLEAIANDVKDMLQTANEGADGNFTIAGGKQNLNSFGSTTQQKLKNLVSATVPTIIVGGNASNVISANLASKTNSLLTTTLIRGGFAGRGAPMAANGSAIGGIPLKIFPAFMTMTTLGCPLFRVNQKWFVDFNTGTNVDTLYIVSQLSHTMSPGKFESSVTFAYHDAYSEYVAPPTIIEALGRLKAPTVNSVKKK